MNRYHRHDEENFPGTAGEFARHLLNRMELTDVQVEATDSGDHYDPANKTVRLTKDKIDAKTLTAITVAAHEVGHAIQDGLHEPMFGLRTRLAGFTVFAQKAGSFLLFISPFLGLLTRAPSTTLVSVIAGILILGSGLVIHLVTLPVELDASFKKALPLLKSGYLEKKQYKAAERILKAAALTYFAASMAGLLNFWRWFQLIRR